MCEILGLHAIELDDLVALDEARVRKASQFNIADEMLPCILCACELPETGCIAGEGLALSRLSLLESIVPEVSRLKPNDWRTLRRVSVTSLYWGSSLVHSSERIVCASGTWPACGRMWLCGDDRCIFMHLFHDN